MHRVYYAPGVPPVELQVGSQVEVAEGLSVLGGSTLPSSVYKQMIEYLGKAKALSVAGALQ